MVSMVDCMDAGGPDCVTMDQISVAGLPTDALPNEGYRVFFSLVILVVLAGLTVAARTWTRLDARQMGADDYAILFALASCVAQMTLWALAVRYGYGADYLLLHEYNRRMFNKWWVLGATFYPVTAAAYKTSVILLNKRIFVQRKFQLASWAILVVNVCWATGNTLGWILQCLPVKSMWGAAEPERCFNMEGEWISLVVWNVATDVAILTMPLPMVWQLNLRRREKILISGVFMLGICVMTCSILSCSAIASSLQADDEDNTLTFGLANLFQVLESNIGIIVSCLPVLHRPLRRTFPKLFGSTKGSKAPYYSYNDRYDADYNLEDMRASSSRRSQRQNSTPQEDSYGASGPKRSDELTIIRETSTPSV